MFTVMIVDDMEAMRRQIKRLPIWGESEGFNIIDEAEDGQDALDKLKKQPVDLLITDIKMPRINGIELLKEVNEKSLANCVVFLSEHSEFNFAKEAIQYGIFDYLVKPVKLEELKKLLEKIKQFIEEKKQAQVKLKSLEEKLVERIDIYYPTSHINYIVEYISDKNINTIESISLMANEAYAIFEHDIMKTAIVLQKAMNEIYMRIKESHGWIDKFVDTTSFVNVNLTCCSTIDLIKRKLTEVIEAIKLTINTFIIESKKSPIVKEICIYSINNIENNISITTISEALFLTKNYIGDIFKQETGMTIGEYIIMLKIARAKKLIVDGDFKSYEIAQKLGYKDTEYFSKVFKKHTGLSPMEFRITFK